MRQVEAAAVGSGMESVQRTQEADAAEHDGSQHHAYRELLRARSLAACLASVALFVVAMTIFGPLDTAESFGALRRLAYWTVCAAVAWPFCHSAAVVVLFLMRFRSPIGTVPAIAVSTLLMGVLCTAVVHTVDTLFRPGYAGAPPLLDIFLTTTIVLVMCNVFAHVVVFLRVTTPAQRTQRLPAAAAGSEDVVASAAEVVAAHDAGPNAPMEQDATNGADPPVSSVPSLPLLEGAGAATPTGDDADRDLIAVGDTDAPATPSQTTATRDRFYDRLPFRVGRDVILLRVDDHYIDVYTTAGHAIILMRLGDAVTYLGDMGMQVHRSYWVAHRHVKGLVRKENRTLLRLTGGHEVPVSRSYGRAVRESIRRDSKPRTGVTPAVDAVDARRVGGETLT